MAAASFPPRAVRRSTALRNLGRAGYAARAIVFAVLGILVVLTGFGLKKSQDDPLGALVELAGVPFGRVLIAFVGIGLAAYVAWNAVIGIAMAKRRTFIGIGYVLTGVFYAPLAWACAKLAFGDREGTEAIDFGALFAAPHGRTLAFVVGGGLTVATVVQLVIGLGRTFTEPLDVGHLSRRRRRAFVALGVVGFLARASLFGLVAGLLVRAAVRAAPSEAAGPDRALDIVLTIPHGVVFLAPLGLGLFAFGIFSALAARRLRV